MATDDFNHPLLNKSWGNLRPLIETARREMQKLVGKGKFKSDGNKQLLEFQFYDYDVFNHACAVRSAFDRLERSKQLIRMFPRPSDAYEKLGIDQHVWIEYHYSHYVITVVSLIDIVLILANSVFRLGNSERNCKADLIMRNQWVAQTPVKESLEKVKGLIEPHKEGRNLHVHRGRVQSIAAVMASDELDCLEVISLDAKYGEPTIDREIIDLAYKGHVEKICERLDAEITKIRSSVRKLFDCLLPIYEEKSTALHEKWKKIAERELERRRNPKK